MLIGRGVAEGVPDGLLGDLVEGDAADAVVRQLERLLQVPGDRLPLAVGVGRQVDQLGPGGGPLQVADRLLLGRDDLVRRGVARAPTSSPSFRLGRSRTCPMLAFTTYFEPRNLWIDLAFLGLSTITSAGPSPLADGPSPAAALRRRRLLRRGLTGRPALLARGLGTGLGVRSIPRIRLACHDAILLSCCRFGLCDERRRPAPEGSIALRIAPPSILDTMKRGPGAIPAPHPGPLAA